MSTRADDGTNPGDELVAGPHPRIDGSLEDALSVLANARRRRVIEYVAALDDDETVTLGDLSRRVAGMEVDKTPENVTGKEYKRVYVALKQTHLQKLDAADAVDCRSLGIARGENATGLAYWLQVLRRAGVESEVTP